jgi:hypothetical protein
MRLLREVMLACKRINMLQARPEGSAGVVKQHSVTVTSGVRCMIEIREMYAQ